MSLLFGPPCTHVQHDWCFMYVACSLQWLRCNNLHDGRNFLRQYCLLLGGHVVLPRDPSITWYSHLLGGHMRRFPCQDVLLRSRCVDEEDYIVHI